MRIDNLKAMIRTAIHGATALLLGAGVAAAQQQVNLTAAPTSLALSDGSTTPMWGYFCGAVVTGSTATCAGSKSERRLGLVAGDHHRSHRPGAAD